jgi:nuclear polyadenylated RNA-binding protein 3
LISTYLLIVSLDLEVSKPQKNTRQAQQQQNNARQDRSPDRAQQNRGGQRRNNGNRNGNDSYDGRSEARDDYGRPSRMRRSPSPPRGSFRGRDDYGGRGRDPYNSRDVRRSRSRSPYNNRDNMRYRERSPSPRRNQMQEPELQIPRREWDKIPDVQIIMMEQLDRGFVEWVEKQFINRGLKTEVMILSPRVSLEAVIQRQILENVHAVSQLTVQSQRFNRIPIQVFKRRGNEEVQWEEYENLDPHIAAELVLREKNTQPPSQAPPIPLPYAPPQQYAPPPDPRYAPAPPFAAAPNLPSTIDQNTLQSILGSLNAHTQNTPAVAANSAVDLAALIGGLQNQQRQQQPPPNAYPPPPVHSYSPLTGQPQQPSYMPQSGQPLQASYMPQPGQIPQQSYMPQAVPPPRENDQQVQNIMATFMRNRQ